MYNDIDIEMAEVTAGANVMHDARTRGEVDFDPTNPSHMSILAGAVESAFYAYTSVMVTVAETLMDYGIRTNRASDDAAFAESDRLKRIW